MTQTRSAQSERPTPGTTPAARAHRHGQPGLHRHLLIVGVAVLAVIGAAVVYSISATDTGAPPEAGGLTTAAPPTGAGTNPDGAIDTASGAGGGMGSDSLTADDATVAGAESTGNAAAADGGGGAASEADKATAGSDDSAATGPAAGQGSERQ